MTAFSINARLLAPALMFLSHAAMPAELPSYMPRQVALPRTATYWEHDAINIVGYNDMDRLFASLNALFIHDHPEFRFSMRLPGTAAAPAALAFGISAFAPMGADFSAHEIVTFRAITGGDPIPFHVAHGSLDPRAKSAPIGIFVNRGNPIQALTTAQVTQIFTTGQKAGDVTYWGQLGNSGEWRDIPIHPLGIAEEAAGGLSSWMLAKMHGLPFAPAFDGFSQSIEVVERVGQDPAAIGFASGNLSDARVKLLKIEGHALADGDYPYDRFLLMYVRDTPDAFIAEYLRLIFSKQGQAAIASAEPHYRSLTDLEAAAELAKLDELTNGKRAPHPKPSEVRSAKVLYIMGAPQLGSLIEQTVASFARMHRSFNPVLQLQGTAAALEGLTAGMAALALCDRAAWPVELRPIRQLQGSEPLDIHIGRIGYAGANCQLPPAVYVNTTNPLAGLTLLNVKQIFERGNAEGDIRRWGQLGLSGKWGDRIIHVYGVRDDGGFATTVRHQYFESLPFNRNYEPFSEPTEAAKAVVQDPLGIVLLDRMDANALPRGIKLLPLANSSESQYSAARYSEIRDGEYPLSDYLHVYINRAADHQADSLIREYVQFLLSPGGQQIIESAKKSGIVPLTGRELAAESAKLHGKTGLPLTMY